MTQPYRIPAAPLRTEIIIRKSRFLTTARLAGSVQEARAIIAAVRAEMPDASHHVYAFRVGFGNSVTEGMSDAGEPRGTAGPPTLAVLRGCDIGDLALVTTRYFGGSKLGTGGLVRAYTLAAQEAIGALQTEWKVERQIVGLELPYSLYELSKRLILEHKGVIDDEVFDDRALIIASFAVDDLRIFQPILRERTSGQAAVIRLS